MVNWSSHWLTSFTKSISHLHVRTGPNKSSYQDLFKQCEILFYLPKHLSMAASCSSVSWIKTTKIHYRRILATKAITNYCCSKNRFCMKSKRQISSIKHFAGAFLIHKFDRWETSSYLMTSVSKNIFASSWVNRMTKTKKWRLHSFHFFANAELQFFSANMA